MSLTKAHVIEAIKDVKGPHLPKSFYDLDMVTSVEVKDDAVTIAMTIASDKPEFQEQIRLAMTGAVQRNHPEARVQVDFTINPKMAFEKKPEDPVPGVRHILMVASGKGGVGKSTVAVNLAFALQKQGFRVGIMDADIYGPSVPDLVGMTEPSFQNSPDGRPMPPMLGDMPVLSIGYFVKGAQAVIWRGPLLHNTLKQFLNDFNWGQLDYLVVDLPPGTGDVQISLTQLLPRAKAVMVATPQAIAMADVTRAKAMFDKVDMEVLGLVENMATFVCPGCGAEHDLWGRNITAQSAEAMDIPVLARLPLEPAVSASAEAGAPVVMNDDLPVVARRYLDLASAIRELLA